VSKLLSIVVSPGDTGISQARLIGATPMREWVGHGADGLRLLTRQPNQCARRLVGPRQPERRNDGPANTRHGHLTLADLRRGLEPSARITCTRFQNPPACAQDGSRTRAE
jgi:hypothetical protein